LPRPPSDAIASVGSAAEEDGHSLLGVCPDARLGGGARYPGRISADCNCCTKGVPTVACCGRQHCLTQGTQVRIRLGRRYCPNPRCTAGGSRDADRCRSPCYQHARVCRHRQAGSNAPKRWVTRSRLQRRTRIPRAVVLIHRIYKDRTRRTVTSCIIWRADGCNRAIKRYCSRRAVAHI